MGVHCIVAKSFEHVSHWWISVLPRRGGTNQINVMFMIISHSPRYFDYRLIYSRSYARATVWAPSKYQPVVQVCRVPIDRRQHREFTHLRNNYRLNAANLLAVASSALVHILHVHTARRNNRKYHGHHAVIQALRITAISLDALSNARQQSKKVVQLKIGEEYAVNAFELMHPWKLLYTSPVKNHCHCYWVLYLTFCRTTLVYASPVRLGMGLTELVQLCKNVFFVLYIKSYSCRFVQGWGFDYPITCLYTSVFLIP